MTLLVGDADLAERRRAASGLLAPLAHSLAADLDQFLPGPEIFVPREKARLSRAGGRCPRDGTWLLFDPREPRRHLCPACHSVYDDEAHYRWWVMGYQLWLAERCAHAAALWACVGTPRYRELAEHILTALADRYLEYPNVDNVLGPTRPFFSTYLESIWLLQLAAALDLLEVGGATGSLGGRVRERLVEPSATLIASYNEGASNRQVWNSAALAAAGVLLGREALVEGAAAGDGGLAAHLSRGLLADGTWYEGENYHLFAHRGLWYLVAILARQGVDLKPDLRRRFDEGFVTPFLSALPDFTFPARRDAQYGVSLRQWRVAESCELGLARCPDDVRLSGALHELYRDDVPVGDAARWRSTAEAERNVPPARLTRAELGWKSLLAAHPEVVPTPAASPRSALLDGQGLAVIRRDAGRAFVALDYGHSGGGHGHPDRLNLWLVHGTKRMLEDPGTGSYVERTLHWYRSTLAHNAPLVDGRSQDRVSGALRAWDERDETGWVDASAEIASGVMMRRSVIAMPTYFVDRLEWSADRPVTVDIPWHIVADLADAHWHDAPLTGAGGLEDGFDFVTGAETAGPMDATILAFHGGTAHVFVRAPHAWWRAVAPGPPGTTPRRFLLVRSESDRGVLTAVWSWTPEVLTAESDGDRVRVRLRNGDVHLHAPDGRRWRATRTGSVNDLLVLDGARPLPAAVRPIAEPTPDIGEIPLLPAAPAAVGALTVQQAPAPLRIRLARAQYRRSEPDWREAGSPEALVSLGATGEELLVEVSVRKASPVFAPPGRENAMDNEHSDINSDGIQLHVLSPGHAAAVRAAWLVVPEEPGPAVRVTRQEGSGPETLTGRWRRTAQGYQVLLRLPRITMARSSEPFWLDIIVNEIGDGRERRRGQLALSAAQGEWVYLRGDRSDPRTYHAFRVSDG